MDMAERQLQLKQVATNRLMKLDPELSKHKLAYVRVVKTPKPSILEVECDTVERFVYCLFLIFHFDLNLTFHHHFTLSHCNSRTVISNMTIKLLQL
jgi:hypothetical protein